jgi:hypothetical protein
VGGCVEGEFEAREGWKDDDFVGVEVAGCFAWQANVRAGEVFEVWIMMLITVTLGARREGDVRVGFVEVG